MAFKDKIESFSIKSKSDIGVLVIHGFSSTPNTVKSLVEKYSKEGFNIECPLLTGHGTNWKDFNNSKYQDWINDVESALFELQGRVKKIFLAGHSMGGALALYLAESHPDIEGIILINHVVIKRDWRKIVLPICKYLIPYSKAVGGDLKDKTAHENAYDVVPTKVGHEFFRILRLVRKNLKNVDQPTLIFKSVEDHVISIENANYTFEKISSKVKDIIWLKNSYHVATSDFDKDIVCIKSLEFIKKITRRS